MACFAFVGCFYDGGGVYDLVWEAADSLCRCCEGVEAWDVDEVVVGS